MLRLPSAVAAASSTRSLIHGFAASSTWHPNSCRIIQRSPRTIAASDLTGSDVTPAGRRQARLRRKPPLDLRLRHAAAGCLAVLAEPGTCGDSELVVVGERSHEQHNLGGTAAGYRVTV